MPEFIIVKDYSLSMEKTQLVVIPVIIFSGLLTGSVYYYSYPETFWMSFSDFFLDFWILFIPGILLHELLHALGWLSFSQAGFSDMKFGFHWKTLTPYAHCKLPMKVNPYRWGCLLPGLAMGIIPWTIALILGNDWLAWFSIFFTIAAGGDLYILWLIRKVKSHQWVKDHPDKIGGMVMEYKNHDVLNDFEK
ncbi:MAG: DUF3267 domain-containing protein [Candidatus Cyclobacteriaceae bacterium M3_2C_046]